MKYALILAASAALCVACRSTESAQPTEVASSAAPTADAPAQSSPNPEVGATRLVLASSPAARRATYEREGFDVYPHEGRLWVFESGSQASKDFANGVEPAKSVTRILPGRTLRSTEGETLVKYLVQRPGFDTAVLDGRLYVFRAGSEWLAKLHSKGDHIVQSSIVGAGPMGMTVRSRDRETIDEYLAWRPGFDVRMHEGRRWIFLEGSPELASFEAGIEPAKSVTRIRPGGSLRAVDGGILDQYEVAAEGFATFPVEGAVWVFREGSLELEHFLAAGEGRSHVTREGAGPAGRAVHAPDEGTLDSYLAALG